MKVISTPQIHTYLKSHSCLHSCLDHLSKYLTEIFLIEHILTRKAEGHTHIHTMTAEILFHQEESLYFEKELSSAGEQLAIDYEVNY